MRRDEHDTVKVIQVIETVTSRGTGIAPDPIRGVTRYWSFDGALLAENDPYAKTDPIAYRTGLSK
jgi:hypothetical protein